MPKNSVKTANGDNELIALKQKLSDYEALLQRIQADFENFKKRTAVNGLEELERGRAEAFKELIPFIESMDEAGKKGLFDGFELMHAQLWALLEKQGFERINALGMPFNPDFHEALSFKESNGCNEGIILEQAGNGFKFKGRVLRHAKVIVSKKPVEKTVEGKEGIDGQKNVE